MPFPQFDLKWPLLAKSFKWKWISFCTWMKLKPLIKCSPWRRQKWRSLFLKRLGYIPEQKPWSVPLSPCHAWTEACQVKNRGGGWCNRSISWLSLHQSSWSSFQRQAGELSTGCSILRQQTKVLEVQPNILQLSPHHADDGLVFWSHVISLVYPLSSLSSSLLLLLSSHRFMSTSLSLALDPRYFLSQGCSSKGMRCPLKFFFFVPLHCLTTP